MIAALLALYCYTAPCAIEIKEVDRTVTVQVEYWNLMVLEYRQSNHYKCCCPHWSTEWWWNQCWPIVKKEAHTYILKLSLKVKPCERIEIELPKGAYKIVRYDPLWHRIDESDWLKEN